MEQGAKVEELSSRESRTFAMVTKQLQISSCGARDFISPCLEQDHQSHSEFPCVGREREAGARAGEKEGRAWSGKKLSPC